MRIAVLRLGHRLPRDKRITTHVGLVARAFGAEEMLLVGRDPSVEESLAEVVSKWGGNFRLKTGIVWREEVARCKEAGGRIVHLTMYGSKLEDVIDEIRIQSKIMVAVGAEKVPAEIFELADWNVAVGNQPHSEVAALAVFLDRLMEGRELGRDLGGKLKIIPDPRGKMVIGERNSLSGAKFEPGD